MLGYIATLLKSLYIEAQRHNKRELSSILNLLDELYETSCESLLIFIDPAVDNSVSSAECPFSVELDSLDYTDWFFDMSDKQVTSTSHDDTPVEGNERDKNSRTIKMDNMFIARGLEHTLPWEYDISRTGPLALPMQLAWDIWTSLSLPTDPAYSAHATSTANSQLCGNVECVCATQAWLCPLLWRVPSMLSAINIRSIQGGRPAASLVYHNSIVLFCDKDTQLKGDFVNKEGTGCRISDLCRFALEGRGGVGFSHIALLDTTIIIDDNTESGAYRDGSGASQQALDLHNELRVVYSLNGAHVPPPSSLQPPVAVATTTASGSNIHTVDRTKTYLERAMVHLEMLDVHLLLCVEPLSSQLVDACYQRGICVLAGTRADILHMSRMIPGCIVVEDILDLDETCVSKEQLVTVDIYDDVRVSDDDEGGTGMAMNDVVMFVLSPRPVAGGLSQEKDADKEKSRGMDRHDGNSFKITDTIINTYMSNYDHSFCTVVLRTPACVLGRVLKDRVQRCVRRLDHVFHRRGGVIPGAGVPEAVCALRLQEKRSQLQKLLAREGNPSKVNDTGGDVSEQCRLIACVEKALEDFVYVVNTNNGVSPSVAMDNWRLSLKSIAHVGALKNHKQCDVLSRDTSITQVSPKEDIHSALSSLKAYDKCNLLPPIRLDASLDLARERDSSQPVLDVRAVRVEAMRSAIYVVKTILNTAGLVTSVEKKEV